jgi:YHS domain-containing protein
MKKQPTFLRTVVGSTVTGLLLGTPVLWPQFARATGPESSAPRHVVRAQSSETTVPAPTPAKNPGGLVGALLRRTSGNAAPPAAAAPATAAPAATAPATAAPAATATPKPVAPVSPPAGTSTAPAASLTKPNPPAAAPPKPVEPPAPVETAKPAETAAAAPSHATTTAATTSADSKAKVQQVSGSTDVPVTSEEPGFFSRIFGGSDEAEPENIGSQDPSRRDMRKTLRDQKKNARLGIPQAYPSKGDSVVARTNSAGQPLTPTKTQFGQQAAASAGPSHSGSKPGSAAPSIITPPKSELDSLALPFADDAPLPAQTAPGSIPAASAEIKSIEGVGAPQAPAVEAPAAAPAPPVAAAPVTEAAPAAAPAQPAPQEEVWNPFADSAAIPSANALPAADGESSEFFTPAAAQPLEPAAFPADAGTAAQIPAGEPRPLAETAPTQIAPAAAAPAADQFADPFTGLKLEASPYTAPLSATPAKPLHAAPSPVPAPAPPAAKQPAETFVPPEPESFPMTSAEGAEQGDSLASSNSPLWVPGGNENPAPSIENDPTLIGPSIIPDPIQAPRAARQLEPSQGSYESDAQEKLTRLKERQDQLGLKGFCLVSLTDHRDLVDSRPEYSTIYRGQKYYFCSEEALAEFEAAPATYVPAAGGHDVVHFAFTGESHPGSLDHAVWYKGKLYMFESVETMETFVAAPSSHTQE